jgi:CubicO group peptidase (beta-lactamase class C family)
VKILLALVIGCLLSPVALAQEQFPAVRRIVEILTKAEENQHFSGATTVTVNSKTVFESSFGFASPRTGLANSPETSFRIGGITRTFTAAAVLKLAGERKIDLNDPIEKYLGERNPKSLSQITIHHLLSESSGIPDYLPTLKTAWKMNFGGKKNPPSEGSEGLVRSILAGRSTFEPGARSEFSHSNTMLLGKIIERVEKTSFSVWMRSWLTSLGLQHTGFNIDSEAADSTKALGLDLYPQFDPRSWIRPPQRFTPELRNSEWDLSASSMHSTTRDLAAWVNALVADRALGTSEREKMFTRHIAKGNNQWSGYGWNIQTIGDVETYVQVGAAPGFYAILIHVPTKDLTAAFLSNYGETPAERQKILRDLLAAVAI